MPHTPKYQEIIDNIGHHLSSEKARGKVASYIPELAEIPSSKFGINICAINNLNCSFGDADEKFSIQSISKVFSLTFAYKLLGEQIWERVDVEPSGDPFNSLVQLEYENGIPRNPFINAGALVVCDILYSALANPKQEMLSFIRLIAKNDDIDFNEQVAESERKTGFRNRALINLMKAFGNIKNSADEVLDFYFHLCSIEMSCKELSKAFLPFAHSSISTHKQHLGSESQIRRINAIMQTCGFYDEAGEFSFRVGLPGKSGVGGGIAAIHPGIYSVAVWSPPLNAKGNSAKGMKALEMLTTELEFSIF